jgi:HlyD family secretion protein
MKRKILLIPVILAALAAAGAAGWYFFFQNDDGPRKALILYGNVEIRQVRLAFEVSERIASVDVEEGERVTAGQVLATLGTDRLKQQVRRAESRVEAQEEQVAELEQGTRREEIRKARAAVNAAETEAANARRTYQRLQPLAAEALASRDRIDNARSKAETAEARLESAKESLNLALEGPRKETIAAARAQLRALEAELDLARQNLADAELQAPSDGVIRNRLLEPGDMASPSRPVLTLALMDPVWVRTYIPETDLGRIAPGMTAEVTTDSFPDKVYKGWIGHISPTAEFTPKSVETPEIRTHLVYRVRVYVCNPRNELRLGMPATVRIPLGQSPGEGGALPPCDGE